MAIVSMRLFCFAVVCWLSSVAIIKINADVAGKQEGSVVRLTRDNYDKETKVGTVVFVKFFAPWCGHCKKMKGDWEQLAEEYNGLKNKSGGVLVTEVDCTDSIVGGGKALCKRFGIKSFPTLKYGDPTDKVLLFEDYNGNRSYQELSVFAKKIILPMLCSPTNLDGCVDETDRKAMNDYTQLSVQELKASIRIQEEKLKTAEKNFQIDVERLTSDYKVVEETKRSAIQRIISRGDLELKRQTLAMLKKQQQQITNEKRIISDEL